MAACVKAKSPNFSKYLRFHDAGVIKYPNIKTSHEGDLAEFLKAHKVETTPESSTPADPLPFLTSKNWQQSILDWYCTVVQMGLTWQDITRGIWRSGSYLANSAMWDEIEVTIAPLLDAYPRSKFLTMLEHPSTNYADQSFFYLKSTPIDKRRPGDTTGSDTVYVRRIFDGQSTLAAQLGRGTAQKHENSSMGETWLCDS